jgi:hypothetical protein
MERREIQDISNSRNVSPRRIHVPDGQFPSGGWPFLRLAGVAAGDKAQWEPDGPVATPADPTDRRRRRTADLTSTPEGETYVSPCWGQGA